MSMDQILLEDTAQVWWGMAARRELRWATVVAWCFGAANATRGDVSADWWTLYHLADERAPEDWERAA